MSQNIEPHLHDGRSGAALGIRISLKSPRDEISGIQPDGIVKVKLTARKIDAESNSALIALLAQVLEITPSKIEIVGGVDSKEKLVAITGISPDIAQERIMKHVA
jgi:uncharacterized protein YggU (UPF0235/DUF167 family)